MWDDAKHRPLQICFRCITKFYNMRDGPRLRRGEGTPPYHLPHIIKCTVGNGLSPAYEPGLKSRLASETRLRAQRPLQMGVLLFANFQCVVRQDFGGVGWPRPTARLWLVPTNKLAQTAQNKNTPEPHRNMRFRGVMLLDKGQIKS